MHYFYNIKKNFIINNHYHTMLTANRDLHLFNDGFYISQRTERLKTGFIFTKTKKKDIFNILSLDFFFFSMFSTDTTEYVVLHFLANS